MRYLGIDYGTKKVGLALSDEAGRMGFPHAVVSNTPALADSLTALIREKQVGAVVIGESKALDGADNPIAGDIRALAEALRERAGIPIHLEPEQFTSALARRQFDTSEKTRSPQKHTDVDASAAALILTSYLSKHDPA